MDFIDTVLGDLQDRNVDFLTIHPRTRSTPSTAPINLEALEILTGKYGGHVPILVSGDVFSLGSLPYTSPYLPPAGAGARGPSLPKLAGLMSARALMTNPALFAGYEACPWEAVELFLNRVVRAPLPFKLVQHHCESFSYPLWEWEAHVLLTRSIQWVRCAGRATGLTRPPFSARRTGRRCTTARTCVT